MSGLETDKPLAIDIFCGLGGWTEGFLAEGYTVIGFDIEQHVYGEMRYPAQLVLQDVRTIHGKQFKNAAIIVASSPCQEFSYRAMPWKRAKALGPPLLGIQLFEQVARIQREACDAAGHFIPMIQENVRGAQKYVGRSKWNFGSYHLWGDVPALMPITNRRVMKEGVAHRSNGETNFHGSAARAIDGLKNPGFRFDGSGKSFQTASVEGTKNTGGSWFNVGSPGQKVTNNNPARGSAVDGVKQPGISGPRDNGKGDRWFQDGAAKHGGKSLARKMASAKIAKIPFPLARYIAQVYKPS